MLKAQRKEPNTALHTNERLSPLAAGRAAYANEERSANRKAAQWQQQRW
jgi:hypothetical protein